MELLMTLFFICCVSSFRLKRQNGTATTSAPLSFSNPSGYSTTSYDAVALETTYRPNTDYSDDALAFLWQQFGPIHPPPFNTTVSPTPEPTMFPHPGPLHPLVPTYDNNLTGQSLPDGFIWGVASSAYQIEGATKSEGKGPSIWDLLTHRVPNWVADNTTADVGALHYFLYKQDIARMAALGIKYFSSSISWPRIFPFGKGPVNQAGVAHYDDVIATLVENGITPVVTLFHWDTLLALFNEYGGWTSEQIVDDFFNYATFIISRYDEYVPIWYTINEPQYCNWQYSDYPTGQYYPAYNNITGSLQAQLICGQYTLLAHAKVAKWYHEEFHGKGRISFKNSGNYFRPNNTNSSLDITSAQRNYDFSIGWFGGPWTGGDYPESLKSTLGDLLPTLNDSAKALINGSCDFYAIDGYTSYTAYGTPEDAACYTNSSNPGYPECAPTSIEGADGFPIGSSNDKGASWLQSTPVGLRRYLYEITNVLFPAVPDIVVSEFGFSEPFEGELGSLDLILWDLRRADYYQSYLDNILASILYDGVNVTGRLDGLSLIITSGLSTRFGLQYVNYTDLSRTPKASMFQFLNWFKEHAPGSGSSNSSTKLIWP